MGNVLEDFFPKSNFIERTGDWCLLPVAVIPFGCAKKIHSNSKLSKRRKDAIIEMFRSKRFQQVLPDVQWGKSEFSPRGMFNDSNLAALLQDTILIQSFSLKQYKILAFILSDREVVFAVRKKKLLKSSSVSDLYTDWIKNKYQFVGEDLKTSLANIFIKFRELIAESSKGSTIIENKKSVKRLAAYNYSFFVVYSNAEPEEQLSDYETAILDPSRVIYSHKEANKIKVSELKKRINGLSKVSSIKRNIDNRSDYVTYFSWSTGLIEGKIDKSVMIEYLLIECELQAKWNRINKLTQDISRKSKKISMFSELQLSHLEMYAVKLNSLSDIGDSERRYSIKNQIIRSSNIFKLIEEYRNLIYLNQQLNHKYITLIAIVISIVTLITTLAT